MQATRYMTTLALALALPALAGHTLVVAKVHAGDRIEFAGGWLTRLAGIAAPAPEEPLGSEVRRFVADRIEGRRVAVFTWTADNTAAGIVRDDDGLPFAEILLGEAEDVDLGTTLLALGFARVDEAWLPDHLGHYRGVEAAARAAGRGLWAPPAPSPAVDR